MSKKDHLYELIQSLDKSEKRYFKIYFANDKKEQKYVKLYDAIEKANEYDEKGNIKSITSYNHSSDDDFATSLKEVHQYTYNAAPRAARCTSSR